VDAFPIRPVRSVCDSRWYCWCWLRGGCEGEWRSVDARRLNGKVVVRLSVDLLFVDKNKPSDNLAMCVSDIRLLRKVSTGFHRTYVNGS
jgi:hypothetical protein